MKRRSLLAAACVAIFAPIAAVLLPKRKAVAVARYLRSVWVWHSPPPGKPGKGYWQRCRMLDLRRGQVFTMKEPDGTHVDGCRCYVVTGNPVKLPAPGYAKITCEEIS